MDKVNKEINLKMPLDDFVETVLDTKLSSYERMCLKLYKKSMKVKEMKKASSDFIDYISNHATEIYPKATTDFWMFLNMIITSYSNQQTIMLGKEIDEVASLLNRQ